MTSNGIRPWRSDSTETASGISGAIQIGRLGLSWRCKECREHEGLTDQVFVSLYPELRHLKRCERMFPEPTQPLLLAW